MTGTMGVSSCGKMTRVSDANTRDKGGKRRKESENERKRERQREGEGGIHSVLSPFFYF